MAERDTRFGGNLERANVGRQYSRAFPSGPPGVDVRYENYQAPRQVDYTRNIPRQTGTPNFRGQPNDYPSDSISLASSTRATPGYPVGFPHDSGSYLANTFGGSPQRNQYINPRGMRGGLGGLQEQAAVDPSDWRTILRILQAGGDPGTETKAASWDTGLGSTDEYQQMAKIHTNQDPGMVNRNKFWFDSVAPEGEAINKVLDMPGMEEMRKGSEGDWNYQDYNKMIPDWLREQLPEDAFETLSDFRNQGYIRT